MESRQIDSKAMPLFYRIRGGHPNAHHFAYYLEYLALHMPDKMLVPALEMLLKLRLTEQRFLDFVRDDCARSGLELIRQLTMRLEREKKLRTLTIRDVKA